MRRLTALVGLIALMGSACGGAATPTAAPPLPSAATITTRVAFDGNECTYDGPATVPAGTNLVFVFENSPAAITDSTTKGAVTIGADLLVVETTAGTTWDAVKASLPAPAGTKGTWPPPAWAVDRVAYGIGPSATVMTTATGSAYYVACHEYWDKAGGPTYAFYPATLIQVEGG